MLETLTDVYVPIRTITKCNAPLCVILYINGLKMTKIVLILIWEQDPLCYAFLYETFSMVENCNFAKEMMDTLKITYERTHEGCANKMNSLVRRYGYFSCSKEWISTNTFSSFNCLNNDMKKFKITKLSFCSQVSWPTWWKLGTSCWYP